jgi:hypothetical protein
VTDDEFKEYLNTRYKQLTDYYDKRAAQNKLGYRFCSIFVIVVSGLLAPLIGTGSLADHKMIGALISASIVVASAILAYFQFNENWLNYRATWDALQREPHFRSAGLGEYQGASDRNSVFVSRIEAIAAREGAQWLARHFREKQEHGKDARSSAAAARQQRELAVVSAFL